MDKTAPPRDAAGMAPRTFSRLAVPLLALASFALTLAAFRPGILVWDAIRQYGQALSGRYDDWHPPAMNWLWRQLRVFGAGPQPMLVLQLALYWGGFALLADGARRRRGWPAALAVLLCAALPVPLMLAGTILKDSLMAGLLLTAAGLLTGDAPAARIAAAALLLGAATLRFNAAVACLPLLLAALPAHWTATRGRLALAGLVALVPLVAAVPLANRALGAARTGVELSLPIYDLAGITLHSGQDAFPPLAVANPVAVNARCYTPVSWDRYAWWGPAPCPIQFAALVPALTARGPIRWWAGQIALHPLPYLLHRAGHAGRNLRLVGRAELPGLSLRSDPNPWNSAVPPRRLRDRIAAAAVWTLGTPLGWPGCWLALGLGLLLLAPGWAADDPAVPILWSATLYGLSYLPLSVASEVRYHFWTETGIALAAVLLVTDGAAARAGGARLALAAAPLALAIALGVALG